MRNQDGELQRRTKQFALDAVALVESLPHNRTADVFGGQLLRAASSVGANYRAACRARSKADFLNKLGIVEEEADEASYWLELLEQAGVDHSAQRAALAQEASEITAMIVASIKSTRVRSSIPHSPFRIPHSVHGVTLIELLVTIIIGSIAMLALTSPFMMERTMWVSGTAQTEAQRDAQLALRAIARNVRESKGYAGVVGGWETFNIACSAGPDGAFGTADDIIGTRQFRLNSGQLQMVEGCSGGTPVTLVDGTIPNRSQVNLFTIKAADIISPPAPPVSQSNPSKRVRVDIDVGYNSNREREVLSTEIFLRN